MAIFSLQGWKGLTVENIIRAVLLSLAFVIVQMILSMRGGLATMSQLRKLGHPKGLPFFAHGGMYGDFFCITPLLGAIAAYSYQWSWRSIVIASLIGTVVSVGLHYMYVQGKEPSCHNVAGKLVAAGWVHFVYMAWALSWIILFYFNTPVVSPTSALIITVALAAFLPLATIQPAWYVHRALNMPGVGQCIGGWALLAFGCWWKLR